MEAKSARVFISCGQRDDERDLAYGVRDMLTKLGYEPYVAVYEQSLRSLRENIFKRLREETEYFLFVDFCREMVGENKGHRGSLFSHQELAIASFMEFDNEDILIFREKGVMERDGMIGAFQGNAIEFGDRSRLVEAIEKSVRGKWRSGWRRELVLEQATDPNCEAIPQNAGERTGFYFHVKVTNRSLRVTARHCYAYLRSLRCARTGRAVPLEGAELKWAGYPFPSGIIPPGGYRRFDAVWFHSDSPRVPQFNIFSDWPKNLPHRIAPGSWNLEYEVVSDTVPGSTISIELEIREDTVIFGRSGPVKIICLSGSQITAFNEAHTIP